MTWVDSFIVTLLEFFTALLRPLLMHALVNFEDLSAQGHRQGLSAEAKTKVKDLPVETKGTNVLEDPQGQGRVLEDSITGYNTDSCEQSSTIRCMMALMTL